MKIKKEFWDMIVSGEKKYEFRNSDKYLRKELMEDAESGKILGICKLGGSIHLKYYWGASVEIYKFLEREFNINKYWTLEEFEKYFDLKDIFIYPIRSFTNLAQKNKPTQRIDLNKDEQYWLIETLELGLSDTQDPKSLQGIIGLLNELKEKVK